MYILHDTQAEVILISSSKLNWVYTNSFSSRSLVFFFILPFLTFDDIIIGMIFIDKCSNHEYDKATERHNDFLTFVFN